MRSKPTALVVILVSVAFSIHSARAAVPVEESVDDSARLRPAPIEPARNDRSGIPLTIEGRAPISEVPSGATAGGAGGSGQLSQLFYQLQLLQQEVATLQGKVEEQEFQIRRLQQGQQDQYRDLDQRVAALSSNRPQPAPASSGPAPVEGGTPIDAGVSTGGVAASGSERESYTTAFEAMRARKFEESLAGFQAVIERYPNGQYTPNAYYWIGELHLAATGDPELARQAFAQVVNLYPDHQKTPDALYKLGVVHQTLGDNETSLRYLTQVQEQHPDSSAANLAKKFAQELAR